MSTVPSATSMYDQKSPYARLRQTRSSRARNGSRRPARPHSRSSEYDSEASDRSATADTCRRRAEDRLRPVHAPVPRAAHHRRPRAGAETTPTTGSRSSSSASSVAQTGTPRTKFFVPSIGSTTHCREPCPVGANSSPTTASRVRVRRNWVRISSSAALSASLTGVRSGLVSTRRSAAWNRDIVTLSTMSALTGASRRSSSYTASSCPRRGSGPVACVTRRAERYRFSVGVMFDTISGLPVHALVVHAVVVLLPLMSLVTIAVAVRRSWRSAAPWVVLADAAVVALAFAAKESGEVLQERLSQVNPG